MRLEPLESERVSDDLMKVQWSMDDVTLLKKDESLISPNRNL